MDAFWKATLDAYMSAIYAMNPQGAILENCKQFEAEFEKIASQNAGNTDIYTVLLSTGLQDKYTSLYIAATSPASQNQTAAAPSAKLPTVKEFLEGYKLTYDSIRKYNRKPTNEAYEALLAVESRTDDLIEAQIIMEKEKLVLNTLIADYKAIAEEFALSIDPHFEPTSATVNASIAAYAKAKTIDEIIYLSELSRAATDDIAVQTALKFEVLTVFASLFFAWEKAKLKIRQGDEKLAEYAASMVLTREKIRNCYEFLCESLAMDFEVLEATPYYRIMLLIPSGLDAFWRIKKVMHPDNIQAIRHILFEEVLSQKTIQEILMTPQAVPYYMSVDTKRDPSLNDGYLRIAKELNKNIPYLCDNAFTFKEETDTDKRTTAAKNLISHSKDTQSKLTYSEK